MLLVFGIDMGMTIRKGIKNPDEEHSCEIEDDQDKGSLVRDVIQLIISAALIAFGADRLEASSVSLPP